MTFSGTDNKNSRSNNGDTVSARLCADMDDRLSQLSRCKSLGALVSCTRDILCEFGINGFFLSELECPASFLSTVGTLPEKLIAGIKANGFHNSDLMLRHLMADPRHLPPPIFRSTVDDHVLSACYAPPAFLRHREFVAYLHSFNIHDIYYFPFKTPASDKSAVFCLWTTGNPARLHQAVSNLSNFIAPLAERFYGMATGKFWGQFSKISKLILSEVQRETLTYIAEKDLTAHQVSALRGVHEVTVNKQVGSAKRALGVTTVPGLIVEALKGGLITIDGL